MADNEEKAPRLKDQGRADVTTGSTTQGGSNYGQGSSQLGGESYRQGDALSAGSNYGNEANKLGSASANTANDGSQSPATGAPGATKAGYQGEEATQRDINNQTLERAEMGDFSSKTDNQEHDTTDGDHGATTRDVDMNLDNASQQVRESGRPDTGSFSQSSSE